jgi:hypothetical protein
MRLYPIGVPQEWKEKNYRLFTIGLLTSYSVMIWSLRCGAFAYLDLALPEKKPKNFRGEGFLAWIGCSSLFKVSVWIAWSEKRHPAWDFSSTNGLMPKWGTQRSSFLFLFLSRKAKAWTVWDGSHISDGQDYPGNRIGCSLSNVSQL